MASKKEFNGWFLHRLGEGKNLVITGHGSWLLLNGKEMEMLSGEKPDALLEKRLEGAGIIVTEESGKEIIERLEEKNRFLFKGISLHIVNPTMRCNQSCVYCYANASAEKQGIEKDLSSETAEKIIDFIFQSPAKDITIEFQGGEPLLRFDTIKFFVEKAKEKNRLHGKNILWNIVTNMAFMDGEKAEFFGKNKFGISTSLDGPREVHEKNRPFTGNSGYEKAVGWIKRLKKDYGLAGLGLLPTITRHSLPYAKELVELYAGLGMKSIRPVVLRRIGRAAENWESIGYGPEEFLKFWKQVVEECIERTRNGSFMSETATVMILLKILGKKFPNYTCFSMPCGAGLMQAAYTPNGDVYTCDEAKAIELFRLGNVEDGYKKVYLSPDALNIVQLSSGLLTPCNECKWQAFCGSCPVTAYAQQGNPISKLPLDSDCVIKKGQIAFVFEKLLCSKDGAILREWAEKAKI